jgi:hypothetical protein
MQQGRQLILGALLILAGILLADMSFAAVIVSKPTADFHVRDLTQEGDSWCDVKTSTWSFELSWTPRFYENELRMSYNVTSLRGSIIGPVRCTSEKCIVQISGMHKNQATAYAWVGIANIGSHSKMKINGIRYCKFA